MQRTLGLVLLALAAWGCGARTELLVETDADVSTSDAADVAGDRVSTDVRDAADAPDAPDAPDAGRCTRDADCASTPATPVCDTSSGRCVACVLDRDCPAGDRCVNFACLQPCAMGGGCAGDTQCCDELCVSRNDPLNCGACGVVCTGLPHAAPACVNTRCGEGACDPGFAECDGVHENGCETNVLSDPRNCGACARPCAADEQCSGGTCVRHCGAEQPPCTDGLLCCDNSGACPTCGPQCTNTATDPNNCGGCNQHCGPLAHATAQCASGRCAIAACDPGFSDCNGSPADGCEVQTATDHNNCGGCGRACGDEQACSGGVCVGACADGCPAGTSCCGAACANLDGDPNNCGACGAACGLAPNATLGCAARQCVVTACADGFANCDGRAMNGCETGVLGDPANCGGCGVTCGPGAQCVAGACRAPGCGLGPACAPGQFCCGDVCVDRQSDPNNCGGCGLRCAAGQSCAAGVCTGGGGCPATPCGFNQLCCSGACRDVRANDANNCGGCDVRCVAGQVCRSGACCTDTDAGGTCGAMVCPGTEVNCGGLCKDIQNDAQNCGGCNVPCLPGQTCIGGRCAGCPECPAGSTCCNGNACVNTQSDPSNCGGCGTQCLANQTCQFGSCVTNGCFDCTPGRSCCGTVCVDEQTDANNCGSCGITCPSGPNAVGVCRTGTCALQCARGFVDCNGVAADGCEANLLTDANHCGGCANQCAPFQTCMNGSCLGCACSEGNTCCNGNTCVDTQTDPNNCGGCNTGCTVPAGGHATALCTNGVCGIRCETGFADCNGSTGDGCETALGTDPNNCGGCGVRCPTGMSCSMGSCTSGPSDGSEGAFVPVANPTYLAPGIHNFTTITIPAGSVVFVAGAGNQSATLDLRANGHVQIDGVIDVSGGPGTQSVVASRSTQQGKAGSGGYTGEGTSAPQPARACEFVGGEPGLRGAMVSGTAGTCTVFSSTTCTDRTDPRAFIFTSPVAQWGGGGGVFTGFRAYGAGGGGFAGGGGGALGAPFTGEQDCSGVTAGGGATAGRGGNAGTMAYNGRDGVLGNTQCDAVQPGISRAWVGGGGGGSIGTAAANDLAVNSTFFPGSGGGGGSADFLQRPAFGGTSGGGGGGGALRIWTSADIVVGATGSLLANGGTGGDAYIGTPASAGCDPQPGAAGGGGSGGLIYLKAPTVSVRAGATVSAAGGLGGAGSVFATGGAGGDGGVGRIRISATPASCTLSGNFNPPLASGCNPTATPTPGRAYVGSYPN